MNTRIAISLALVLAAAPVRAQSLKEQASASPKTKLEAFTGENGAVLIKGYTTIATIRSVGTLRVSAMTFKNAKTGDETKGLSFGLTEASSYSSETTAFVDYDEVVGLLAGIDYISNTDTSATKLANFEAIYSTKGNLKITVFNNTSSENSVAVDVSRIGRGAFFKMSDLAKIREAVVAAKQILDNPDSVAAKGARLTPPTPTVAPPPVGVTTPSPASQQIVPPRPKPKPAAAPASAGPMKLN